MVSVQKTQLSPHHLVEENVTFHNHRRYGVDSDFGWADFLSEAGIPFSLSVFCIFCVLFIDEFRLNFFFKNRPAESTKQKMESFAKNSTWLYKTVFCYCKEVVKFQKFYYWLNLPRVTLRPSWLQNIAVSLVSCWISSKLLSFERKRKIWIDSKFGCIARVFSWGPQVKQTNEPTKNSKGSSEEKQFFSLLNNCST